MSKSTGADFGNVIDGVEEMLHFNMDGTRDWGIWSKWPGTLSWAATTEARKFEVCGLANQANPAVEIMTTIGADISGAQWLKARNVYPFVDGEGVCGAYGFLWSSVSAKSVFAYGPTSVLYCRNEGIGTDWSLSLRSNINGYDTASMYSDNNGATYNRTGIWGSVSDGRLKKDIV
jgi:hypothetical protein